MAWSSTSGYHGGLRAAWPFLGPAFIAAVAYVDPGNFATNLAGGARFGYMLLWVILAANLMAMLIQDDEGQAWHRHGGEPAGGVPGAATDLAEFIGGGDAGVHPPVDPAVRAPGDHDVLSQVALSFGIPFALIPLVMFCRNRSLMGTLANRGVTTAAVFAVAVVIVCLNVFLLEQMFAGPM